MIVAKEHRLNCQVPLHLLSLEWLQDSMASSQIKKLSYQLTTFLLESRKHLKLGPQLGAAFAKFTLGLADTDLISLGETRIQQKIAAIDFLVDIVELLRDLGDERSNLFIQ